MAFKFPNLLLVVLAFVHGLLPAIGAIAQGSPTPTSCGTEIVVGVMRRDGRLLGGLTSSSFAVEVKKKTVPILSMEYNQSDRRIVIVVDRGQAMNEASRTLTKSAVEKMLSHPRPQDSFALITSGRDSLRIPFGTSASDILAQFNGSRSQQRSRNTVGFLDAITEAASWFQTPRLGDGILAFAGDDELNDSKANFNGSVKTLQQHGIRTFAMLFGYVMGKYTVWTAGNTPFPVAGVMSPPSGDLYNLAYSTGGYVSNVNTHNFLKDYKLDSDHIKQTESTAWQLYGGIAEFYVLGLSAPFDKIAEVNVRLTPDMRTKFPDSVLVFSKNAASCSTASAKASQN